MKASSLLITKIVESSKLRGKTQDAHASIDGLRLSWLVDDEKDIAAIESSFYV